MSVRGRHIRDWPDEGFLASMADGHVTIIALGTTRPETERPLPETVTWDMGAPITLGMVERLSRNVKAGNTRRLECVGRPSMGNVRMLADIIGVSVERLESTERHPVIVDFTNGARPIFRYGVRKISGRTEDDTLALMSRWAEH